MTGLRSHFRFGAKRHSKPAAESELKNTPFLKSEAHLQVFSDAVHQHLDGRRPGGTSSGALKRLANIVKETLRPKIQRGDGSYTTNFSHIEYLPKSNKFKLNLENNRSVYREQSEIALHIYLQSQFRQRESKHQSNPIGSDTGDSLAPEIAAKVIKHNQRQKRQRITSLDTVQHQLPDSPRAPTATDSPDHPPPREVPGKSASTATPISTTDQNFNLDTAQRRPSVNSPRAATEATETSTEVARLAGCTHHKDYLGNKIATFDSQAVYFTNLNKEDHGIQLSGIDYMLTYTSHDLKRISDQAGSSWWRAAWIGAITKHSGISRQEPFKNFLRNRLGTNLTPELDADIENIGDMMNAVQQSKLSEIMTEMELANRTQDLGQPSCLKLPGTQDPNDTAAEDSCRRLTDALLKKAGVPNDAYILNSSKPQDGGISIVATLMGQLDTECVIYSRALDDKGDTNLKASAISVCAQSESQLSNIESEINNENRTTALIHGCENLPVLLNENGRYSVCVLDCYLIDYPT